MKTKILLGDDDSTFRIEKDGIWHLIISSRQ
jgi:hypothetical protein